MSFFQKLEHLRKQNGDKNFSTPSEITSGCINNDDSDDKIYDGNILEIKFDKDSESNKSTWKATLHFLTGDLFPMKNFVLSKKKETKSSTQRGEVSFLEQIISFIVEIISSSEGLGPGRVCMLIGCIFGLGGYLYYRWIYLRRREIRKDFVDFALEQKFKFIK
ncbi:predicted protein [Naegleria gruberi]|uniref:Predicted protein n=1 Tax=Naegleria gruberi TaxID=5762 RepID=D2UY78_NAEGR|nr:uncharacterized protein NAEGRDRAFT_61374 [Naegleria gruberi]EFC50749.1 predicted protein [Naegleria gruberi]|eukprot:XP_002683493.1 predicted protein [Naegleria gruberi strain NEG-M]